MWHNAIAAAAVLLTLSGYAFYLLGLVAARSFHRQLPPAELVVPPGVSILKPLKGADPEMYAALRSHCVIDYPRFEIVFGVNSLDDAAVPYIEKLRQEFPANQIKLVVCERVVGANRKVSNLAQMADEAQYSTLVINDGDITVPRDYLHEVVRWFTPQPGDLRGKVGFVTCLYRARSEGFWALIEKLGVDLEFMPGALTARLLEGGVHFGLGATLACTREALAAIGGFASIADYLADDYELANRVVQAGFRAELACVVVETAVPRYGWLDLFRHQARWARTVRSSRPKGYFGMVLTHGLFWSAVTVAMARGAAWSWALLALVFLLRSLTASVYGRLLGDAGLLLRDGWAIPIRDMLAPLFWLTGLFGNVVEWRGERFRVRAGKLQRIEP